MSNYPAGAEFDPRNPVNEDNLCSDCREEFALNGRSICGQCLRDRMEDERLERMRQD